MKIALVLLLGFVALAAATPLWCESTQADITNKQPGSALLHGTCLTAKCAQGRNKDWDDYVACEKKVGIARAKKLKAMKEDNHAANDYAKAMKSSFARAFKDDAWPTDVCEKRLAVRAYNQQDEEVDLPMASTQLFGVSLPAEFNYGYWASVLGWQWHEGRNYYEFSASHALTYIVYLKTLTHAVISVPEKFHPGIKVTDTPLALGNALIDNCIGLVDNVKQMRITCLEIFNIMCTPNDNLEIFFLPMMDATFNTAPTVSAYEAMSDKDKWPTPSITSVTVAGPARWDDFDAKCKIYESKLAGKNVWLDKLKPWIDADARTLMIKINNCLPPHLRVDQDTLQMRMLNFAETNPAKNKEIATKLFGGVYTKTKKRTKRAPVTATVNEQQQQKKN